MHNRLIILVLLLTGAIAILYLGIKTSSIHQYKEGASLLNKEAILAAHNDERQLLGIPPLQWDDNLVLSADGWAKSLSKSGGKLVHSRSGENLWMGTAGYFSNEAMVSSWADEKSAFKPGTFPDISTTGKWQDVGHYSQMIWKTTFKIGCSLTSNGKNDYLVCHYSPPGNVVGQTVF